MYIQVCFNRKSLSDGINNLHTNFPIERKNFIYRQDLQQKICKPKQDCFGTRNLSEFYIIIFLNKLKLVENTKKQSTKNKMKKIKIKCLWLRLWALQKFIVSFLALRAPDRCTGWTPSHRPYIKPTIVFSFSSVVIVYCCVLYQHWTYNVRIFHKDEYKPKIFVTAQKYLNIHVYMTWTITFMLNPVIDHQTLSDQVSHIFLFKSKIP